MRKLTIALTPAFWLAFSGAAPLPPVSPQALAECRATHAEAVAAVKTFTVEKTNEIALSNGKRTIRTFVQPAGLRVFGLAPRSFGSVDTMENGNERLLVMSIVPFPYEQVEAAALKGHGLSRCPDPSSDDAQSCAVFHRTAGGWTTMLLIKQYEKETGIGCSYARADD